MGNLALRPGARAEGPTALRVDSLTKHYSVTRAVDGVDLAITSGEIHALLGGNGSGKTTLIKILAGVVQADGGTLEINGTFNDLGRWTPKQATEAGLRFVHQESTTLPDLSVAENLAVGRGFETGLSGRIRWSQQRRRATEVLERFRIDASPSSILRTLAPAQQKMVAIARALQDQDNQRDGVLFLDEPTAALPDRETDRLLEALRHYADAGQAIVYVSHRFGEILRVADRATVLRDGRVAGRCARNELTHDRLVAMVVGRALGQDSPGTGSGRKGQPVLSVERLTGGAAREITLTIRAGEIVGLAGLLGSGRSSLLRSIFGAVPRTGVVRVDSRVVRPGKVFDAMDAGIALVPEDRAREAAFMDLDITDNLSAACVSSYWRRMRLQHRRERADARELTREFLIKAPSVQAPLATLSGGNQQKVVVARWLRGGPRVLLLDEPTQGVDIGARAEIHQLIRRALDAGSSALLVSSDFEELAQVADRVAVLVGGRVGCELAGHDLSADRLTHLSHAVPGTR